MPTITGGKVFTFVPGDTIALQSWEFEYNGLVFGGAQPYSVLPPVDGLDRADSRIDETIRTEEHGSFLFAQFMATRRIVITGDVATDTQSADMATKIATLRSAFAPRAELAPLRYLLPGDSAKRVYCKPTRLNWSHDADFNLGLIRYTVEFMAEDPRIYEDVLTQQDIFPGDPNIGADFPIDFPISFGGGNIGVYSVTNAGTIDTWPFIRVFGPITNPTLIHQGLARSVQVNITLLTTDYLDIDFDAKTILLNGQASRYSSLDPSSQWWPLQSGANSVQFLGSGISSGITRATVYWRGAWD